MESLTLAHREWLGVSEETSTDDVRAVFSTIEEFLATKNVPVPGDIRRAMESLDRAKASKPDEVGLNEDTGFIVLMVGIMVAFAIGCVLNFAIRSGDGGGATYTNSPSESTYSQVHRGKNTYSTPVKARGGGATYTNSRARSSSNRRSR